MNSTIYGTNFITLKVHWRTLLQQHSSKSAAMQSFRVRFADVQTVRNMTPAQAVNVSAHQHLPLQKVRHS